MRKVRTLIATLVVFMATVSTASAHEAPQIEVTFVLDTTGSMAGLIDGAKSKIWDVANMLISAEPTPEIRFGLIGYRDRGDTYVTQVHDLTDNIDEVYGNLQSFQAGGGGDGPESVNQALHEAVSRLSWRDDDGVLRIIFLVGDAPPHMDYDQDVRYHTTLEVARRNEIVVNAIQCGSQGDTEAIWREIAQLGAGEYSQIGQNGGVEIVQTPFDEELMRLNVSIGETIVGYGSVARQNSIRESQRNAEAAPPSASADRLSYNSASGTVVGGGGDLVDAIADGTVDLGDVDDDELPTNMRSMSPAERAAYIEQQTAQRAAIQTQIDNLLTQRRQYLEAERARRLEAGELNGFDAEVHRMLRSQAADAGIRL